MIRMVRVAINGFGRIGRALLRASIHDPGVEIVAINDLGDLNNLAYLLRYDSVYREFPGQISVEEGALKIGAKSISVTKKPLALKSRKMHTCFPKISLVWIYITKTSSTSHFLQTPLIS